MDYRIQVRVREEHYEMIKEIAEEECRDTRQQARYMFGKFIEEQYEKFQASQSPKVETKVEFVD